MFLPDLPRDCLRNIRRTALTTAALSDVSMNVHHVEAAGLLSLSRPDGVGL